MNTSGIPSPPSEWRSFNLGQWLRDLGLDWFGLNLVINAYAVFILLGIAAAVWLPTYFNVWIALPESSMKLVPAKLIIHSLGRRRTPATPTLCPDGLIPPC